VVAQGGFDGIIYFNDHNCGTLRSFAHNLHMGEIMVKGANGAEVKVLFQGLQVYDTCHLCVDLKFGILNISFNIAF
jgi:hypothetical protein